MDMRAAIACFHCSEAVAGDCVVATVAGEERDFCCAGCAAAANWIAAAELGDYYRLRSVSAGRVGVETSDFRAWDGASVLSEHAAPVEGGLQITVLTDAMRCAACAWLIDRALRRENGVLDVVANAITGRIVVRWDPRRVALSALMARLAALGYRPWLATGEAREQARRDEQRRWLLRIGIAGLGAMQAMMFSDALYWDVHGTMAVATRDFFRWITCLVATPVVFYAGWPFLQGMLREWRGRRLGMETLIAGSTLLAWGASIVETLRGGPHIWFDAAAMFVLLLLVARVLQQRARAIAGSRVDAMARARPALATRERADAATEQVPLAALAVGDVVRVAAGEAVPADAVVLDAPSDFDESLLTGEATPAVRQPGEVALAGSICHERPARLRVARTGSDTRLSQLIRLVEQAQGERPALARTADRIAGAFVAGLLACAVAVFAWWHWHEPSRALEVTLALLVVSCPCALSLAIPAALTVAHGALARIGVLGVRPDALASLARVDRIVFDKTGTLGTGASRLDSVETFDGESPSRALDLAAALERDGRHPLARALAAHASPVVASELRAKAGLGVEGVIDGQLWRIGRADFAAARADDGAVWLGNGRGAVARFALSEPCRTDAAAAIGVLRSQDLGIELCSGDSHEAVERFAALLDIDAARARQLPEDKLARVRELQRQGHVVAMVGDGINDAPVLAGADVAFAIGEGAALAQRAADFVLAGPSLLRIPQAIALARRTRRIVRQNLAWAIAYNLAAIPLAAAGAISPWLAALGMTLSSLFVTANALRLARPEA